MITLIADSGSTKTDWLLLDTAVGPLKSFITSGLNPCLMTDEDITRRLTTEVRPKLAEHLCGHSLDCIRFYGAGCRPDQISRMAGHLSSAFSANDVEVASDLLGAARALCGRRPGIVGILGTGSGSALYDGRKFQQQTPSLGYILGDEGSGAVLGRRLLGDIFKRQLPETIVRAFEEETYCTIDDAICNVYREPAPNRYLAQFTHFLADHREDENVHALLVNEFRLFFSRNVAAYCRPNLPVHLVGSIAHVFAEELQEAAEKEGCKIGRVLRSPIDGLGDYYVN